MEYLNSLGIFFGRILGFSQKQTPREYTRSDAYLNTIYKILTWEQPKLSFGTLVALLLLLWLIVQLEIKFYSIIFITILIILVGDYCLEQKNFQVDQQDESADQIRQMMFYLSDIVVYLRTVRQKHPMPFCIVMCMLFLWLTVIARNFSGVTLAYLGLIGLFIGPALMSRLPPKYIQSLKECVHTLGSNRGVLAESELIPYLSTKERDNDMDSLQTDRTMDSLISGITSMPSYLEAEKDIEEDDLELPLRLTRESSTDTDSDKKSMDFESSHFNGDSSSEDEKRYCKGLKFTDVNNDLPTGNHPLSILHNLTSVGSNFISNVLQATPKRKDSDSDFEIIDCDEVANS